MQGADRRRRTQASFAVAGDGRIQVPVSRVTGGRNGCARTVGSEAGRNKQPDEHTATALYLRSAE